MEPQASEVTPLVGGIREGGNPLNMRGRTQKYMVAGAAVLCVVSYLIFFRDSMAVMPDKEALMGSTTSGMVGGDRDEHGCIGSAGYRWCEGLKECVRPWLTDMNSC